MSSMHWGQSAAGETMGTDRVRIHPKRKVKSINTTKVKGKVKIFKGTKGKRADYKKAIVSLKEGENLDYSGGVN